MLKVPPAMVRRLRSGWRTGQLCRASVAATGNGFAITWILAMSMVSLTPEEAISISANLGNHSPFDCLEDGTPKVRLSARYNTPGPVFNLRTMGILALE